MDFLKSINFKEVSDISLVNLDEVNRQSDIPMRFANARLSDTEIDKFVYNFATQPVSDKVLLLSGNVGTGKSTKLCGAMHERALLGLSAGLYLSCRTLCAKIRSSKSFSARINEEELYDIYAKTPFLVIDEMGRGDDEKAETQFISTVLALRYDNNLSTAIGTNLSPKSVQQQLNMDGAGADIVDRLSSVLLIKTLTGDSLRPKQ